MGKSIFDKYAKPKVDPVKAPILERINALGLTNADGAEIMGVGENTYIKRIRHQHTDEWTLGEIKRMCRGLKVEVDDLRGAVRL
jgi:DNA-binding Xre family transcriptional regulator